MIGFQVETWSKESVNEFAIGSGMIFVLITIVIIMFKGLQEYKRMKLRQKQEEDEDYWFDDSFLDANEFNRS